MVKVYGKEKTVNSSSLQSGKKPYKTPVIKIYGDIRAITQSLTTTHPTADAGTFPNPTRT
jgi:hypothetical protein